MQYYRLLSFFFVLILLVTASKASADIAGTVPIGADRTIASWAGIPDNVQVWNPNDPSIGKAAGEAKQYIAQHAQDLRNSKAPVSNPDNIKNLNSAFAQCLAKFMQAYMKMYPSDKITIVSAFRCGPRSDPKINCNRNDNSNAGGAGGSNHQIGVAADIDPGHGAVNSRVQAFARANPQFGITFPYSGWDDPHLQATNTSKPSCQGVDGVPVNAASGNFGSQAAPFSSSIGSMLGQQQTYNPAASYAASQPLTTTSAQPYTSTGSTGSTVSGGSVSTGSSVPTSGGTTGTSIPTSGTSLGDTSGGLGGGNYGYGTTSTSTDASSTDVWDQLLAMSQGPDTNANMNSNDATGTPVDLNNNLGDASGLNAAPPDQTQQVPQGQSVIQTSNAPATTSNTFTSPNMTDMPETSPQPSTFGSSMFSQALEKLKLMLLAILDQLKPLLVPFYASSQDE